MNNKSVWFKDWTVKKLISEAKAFYGQIHIHECYGIGDIQCYQGILEELEKRGYEGISMMNFYKKEK